jgi:hypothetical protein
MRRNLRFGNLSDAEFVESPARQPLAFHRIPFFDRQAGQQNRNLSRAALFSDRLPELDGFLISFASCGEVTLLHRERSQVRQRHARFMFFACLPAQGEGLFITLSGIGEVAGCGIDVTHSDQGIG